MVTFNTEVAVVQSDRGDLPLCVFTTNKRVKQTHNSAATVL